MFKHSCINIKEMSYLNFILPDRMFGKLLMRRGKIGEFLRANSTDRCQHQQGPKWTSGNKKVFDISC